MELYQAIKNRRSIRSFKEKKISEDGIEKLIDALRWAPSAGNLESRKFYFIFNNEIKQKLAQAALGQSFIAQAPLVVVGCADNKITQRYGERGKDLYSICDVSAAIENMLLMAYDQGLGTVWIGAFDEKKVAEILELPENLRPIAIIPVGYPNENPFPPERKDKEEIIVRIN